MPIVVTCPKCPTKLSAPESAAGKNVRCPKCGALAPVPAMIPAEDEPVVETTASSTSKKANPKAEDDKPRKKAPRDEDEVDDDDRPRKKKRRDRGDEEDEPPRKQKRKKAAAAPSRVMIAIIAGVGLLVLVGVGLGIYAFSGKNGSGENTGGGEETPPAPPPQGWSQHSFADVGFRAYFPERPDKITMPVNVQRDFPDAEAYSIFNASATSGVHIEIIAIKCRGKVPNSARNQLDAQPGALVVAGQSRTVRWLGHSATEVAGTNAVVRVVYTDRHAIVATVAGPHGKRAGKEIEDGFFTNFALMK